MATRQQSPSTRDRILQAAVELFYAHGYAGTGMAEILKKAEANSGSFYFFFTGKEELLLAVLDWYLESLRPVLLDPVFRKSKDPVRRIFLLLEKYRENILATHFGFGCPLGRLALEIEPDRRAVHDKIAANFTGWSRAVEELLKQAQPRLPRRCDVRQLSRLVLTVMEGAVMQARSYQCIEPFDDCIAQLRMYFEMLEREKRNEDRGHRPAKKTQLKRRRR
ncbi:MAG TPA: TetR/AcrR family transcriptional regulator [Candidatus Angelobacter sp.]|nr:TetR/AcrR family transcriptional regulator [Candidatus Angelobacter sp.]